GNLCTSQYGIAVLSKMRAMKNILVAGAGSIGLGVACSFANSGFQTQVLSRNPDRLRGKLPPGVEVVSALPGQAPDLIIESIPEHATLKHELYAAVEDTYAGASILASNTSSLPLD